MRLDRFLVKTDICSRSEAKKLIRSGRVCVNGEALRDPSVHVDENFDEITFDGETVVYEDYRYYMLNKPQGYVSATEDGASATVLDLLEGVNKKDLFPVGRLDKDTEGLLLITNDGKLAHELLSPKKHVDKRYYAKVDKRLTSDELTVFAGGIDIGDEKPTLPARIEECDDTDTPSYLVTISEGRYHQIKRMFNAFGANVTFLKRLSMGSLVLDKDLESGQFRKLEKGETDDLLKIGEADG